MCECFRGLDPEGFKHLGRAGRAGRPVPARVPRRLELHLPPRAASEERRQHFLEHALTTPATLVKD